MLVDNTNGMLEEARTYADKIGLREQLEGKLDYLAEYSDRETRCLLFPDFAPQSFAFTIQVQKEGEWRPWFNGGLIYHGSHDSGGDGGAPTFSVSLSPTHGWSVHT